VLVIRSVEAATFVPVFWGVPQCGGMKPLRWHAYCKVRGLLALAAERDADLVGFAVAESVPEVVHILSLVGDAGTCRLLLQRLVMAAGERDVSGWCPIDDFAVRRLLRRVGFVRIEKGRFQGRPSYLYYWDRNEDVLG
jgi:hypothetical protein